MKTLTIIDTFGFFFRLFYALSSLKNKDGKPSGMISGFANFIANLKNEFNSDYIVFALDSKGKTFRSDIDPNYKANRPEPPKALLDQLPVCIEMIEKMGLCSFCQEEYEADDIIASFVKKYSKNMQINIVTHDKDLYQLIDENVRIYSPAKKMLYDRDGCFEKYGVWPEQVRDFLGICGDSADNIPGIKGIGEKGAKKLLENFGSLEKIYENIDNLPQNRQKDLLIEGKENAFMSKKLASLYDGLEVPELLGAEFPTENPLLKITEILKEYNLNRILSAIENSKDTDKTLNFKAITVSTKAQADKILNDLENIKEIAFDTETTSVDSHNAKIVGFSFCWDEKSSFYVPLAHSYLGAPDMLDKNIAKRLIEAIYTKFIIGQNLKYDFRIVRNNFGLNPPAKYADTMILAWLMDPDNSVGMDNLAKRYFDYDTIKFENVVKKGENFSSVDVKNAANYASEDAWITLKFYNKFCGILSTELLDLAKNLEFPFIKVLLNMEENGIKMDISSLKEMINEIAEQLKILTNEIYDLSGENFNINSTKQLGEVLFEHLGLPAKKKTKTGYSTNESALSAISELHAVVPKILAYRELYKLQSTYTEPLLALALKNDENRIFSNFLQTGTSTGRLSSKNPNLQNIPAHGSMAVQMRNCFVSKDGFSFVGLDYSQIELRLLAHFSLDKELLRAFREDEDIHSRTAISIFGTSDKEKRAVAKTINFGLIYGMGASKLSNELGISRSDAKDYIEKYFKAFASIKNFMENLKSEAKKNGYTTTLFGRKRYFDFANATPMQFAMYERESVNTKFQGSAADIIKKAMVEISPFLNENARLLLQIHDELIFEARDDISESFGKKMQEIMQNVVKLNVPLKTSLSINKRWGDLK